MNIVEYFRRMGRNSDKSVRLLDATVQSLDNQSRLLNDKLGELIEGMKNQSRLLNDRLEESIEGMNNQSRLLNDKLKELIEGMNNQSRLLNDKLKELIEGMNNQSRLLNDKLTATIHRQNDQIKLHEAEIAAIRAILTGDRVQVAPVPDSPTATTLETALAHLPLMIDAKTYNTSHPDYDSALVRNFPGKIFKADKPCDNAVYANLRQFARGDIIQDSVWDQVLKDALEEAMTVPHADQVFERRAYIENYMKEITRKYQAHYAAGWVNLDDALFLYWLVRKLRPKTIVQTGVCNGLSSAFMMLGLVKNSSGGRLHAIDMPPVFNSKDAGWTVKGKVYGVVIPEGKSSGWIVPDAYRDRFEVWNGDAKALLPKMVDKVDSIDFFYHDSDHTYEHMMFEFREARRKLRPGGLIVSDDVSWNASVWDFADEYEVPYYNFKGAVGVAFF
jgi:predicted O-methyltransferase YrrM